MLLSIAYLLSRLAQTDWPDGESIESISKRLSPADLESQGHLEMNLFKAQGRPGMLSIKICQEDGTILGIVKRSLSVHLTLEEIDAFIEENTARGYIRLQ